MRFRVILASAVFAFHSLLAVSAMDNISVEGRKAINDFWNFKMNLSVLEDRGDGNALLDDYERNNAEMLASLDSQSALIMENLILMERYNCTASFAGENKDFKKPFNDQRRKNKKFIEDMGKNNVNEFVWLTYGDITSYYMSYSVFDILIHGMAVKEAYQNCVKAMDSCSPGLLNLGQWYYFAPKFFGGSRETAMDYYHKALAGSVNDGELYYTDILISQLYFENKDFEKAAYYLDMAEKCCPGSVFVRILKEQNAMGVSMIEYNSKQSSILKEADDYKKKKNLE